MRTRTDPNASLPWVFLRLMGIGRIVADDPERVREAIQNVVGDELINRPLPRPYFEKAERLPTDDLVLLIRGLVSAESHLHWLGGSAATGIRLFKILDEKDPGRADLIGEWILQQPYNPYLPCGWIREGTYMTEQYRQIPVRREAQHRLHAENCRQMHEQALRRRQLKQTRGEERKSCKRQHRLSGRYYWSS